MRSQKLLSIHDQCSGRINHQMVTFAQDKFVLMFKNFKKLYKEYRPYVRVDLIMYGVLILAIILYFIVSIII